MVITQTILVDTSILIEAQRKSALLGLLEEHRPQLVISRITACELIFGARNENELKQNQELAVLFPILEVDPPISELSYSLISRYGLKSHLGLGDSFIAATAIAKELPLWTLNIKHFAPIRGLKLYKSE